MTIEILPARLANQIAAGEVVERPASVVKELVENSLDAGATAIKIDIEKGGAKRIRISDNGSGIVKDELTLALSRHATSKIKNLNDLEGIASLGFRGEALASISSVSRLTLTSKTAEQESAWQANAQGRDMAVTVQPAAHPNGTTIDVVDLFFNTPARRKFLRTEKTEFSHIEEVIKRIALATFNVSFTLTHNGKIIRQYRQATTKTQNAKRVAQVCGQAFIDNALEVDCQHEGLQLTGWIGLPSFGRKQNDLCYSYVNGRMMRDKLINHAIRQAYNELLPADTYPAFVLFLQLDCRDVDVNVHPAKHEVRFHQGRYVHDFIYSVCHQALVENSVPLSNTQQEIEQSLQHKTSHPHINHHETSALSNYAQTSQEYIKPLTQVSETDTRRYQTSSSNYTTTKPSSAGVQAYQQLITPLANDKIVDENQCSALTSAAKKIGSMNQTLQFIAPSYGLYYFDDEPRLLSLPKWETKLNHLKMAAVWHQTLTSQPLLLPIKLALTAEQLSFIEQYQHDLNHLGIVAQVLDTKHVQLRQFPALLRHQDVSSSFMLLLETLLQIKAQQSLTQTHWQDSFILLMSSNAYDQEKCSQLWLAIKEQFNSTIKHELHLNSVKIDLTSAIQQLN